MKENNILYIGKPYIETYSTETNLLAMFYNSIDVQTWFFENYFQLFANNRFQYSTYIDFWAPLLWDNCPFIHVTKINEIVDTNLINSLITAINNNSYIFLALNHRYLFNSYTDDFVHETLIYGYNIPRKKFYIADFFNNKYSFLEVTFKQIYDSFKNCCLSKIVNDSFDKILFIQPTQHTNYIFSLQNYKNLIEDYLYSKVTIMYNKKYRKYYFDHPEKHIFGINVYNFLINKIESYYKVNDDNIDIRGFHMLYSHKTAMLYMLNLLIDKGVVSYKRILQSQLAEIIQLTLLIRNIVLKYNMNHDAKLLDKIIDLLTKLQIEERIFLQNFLKEMP